MASQIAAREAEIKQYEEQLETVVSALQGDSDNAELKTLKGELEQIIALQRDELTELTAAAATESTKAPPPRDRWSRDAHTPADAGHRKLDLAGTDPSAPAPAVNDTVLAQWTSGDRKFYPARITSITGSAAAPVYTVVFKSYGNTETVRGHEIKPATHPGGGAGRKRKAEDPIAPPPPPPAPAPSEGGKVISAAAAIDPELAREARREAGREGEPEKPAKAARKVKANKELEAAKSKWQDFNAKGKFGKGKRKESMFRTGEGVNARVGFTGSGQAMRKDPSRSRHTYEYAEEEY